MTNFDDKITSSTEERQYYNDEHIWEPEAGRPLDLFRRWRDRNQKKSKSWALGTHEYFYKISIKYM
jgi:hypothetical protein